MYVCVRKTLVYIAITSHCAMHTHVAKTVQKERQPLTNIPPTSTNGHKGHLDAQL